MSRSPTRCIARDPMVSRSARHSPQGRLDACGAGAASTPLDGAAPPFIASTPDPAVTCLRLGSAANAPTHRATATLVIFEGQAMFRLSSGDLFAFRAGSRSRAEGRP
jgi:hypothetical protein